MPRAQRASKQPPTGSSSSASAADPVIPTTNEPPTPPANDSISVDDDPSTTSPHTPENDGPPHTPENDGIDPNRELDYCCPRDGCGVNLFLKANAKPNKSDYPACRRFNVGSCAWTGLLWSSSPERSATSAATSSTSDKWFGPSRTRVSACLFRSPLFVPTSMLGKTLEKN